MLRHLVLLLVLLLCWRGVQGARPVAATTHAPVVFSSADNECLAQKKVRYSGNGQCYDLVQRGPCPRGQWLVMDQREALNGTGALRAVCQPCPCCDRLYYVWWPAEKACKKKTPAMCPQPGMEVANDVFGEGECACVADPPHLPYQLDVNRTDVERCFQLYTRGPCRSGEILMATVLRGYGRVAHCRPDPCRSFNERSPPSRHYAATRNGTCHELGTLGPCTGTQIYKVSDETWRSECVTDTNSIFVLPERCDGGDCPVEVNVGKDDKEAYAWSILMAKDRKKRRTKNTI